MSNRFQAPLEPHQHCPISRRKLIPIRQNRIPKLHLQQNQPYQNSRWKLARTLGNSRQGARNFTTHLQPATGRWPTHMLRSTKMEQSKYPPTRQLKLLSASQLKDQPIRQFKNLSVSQLKDPPTPLYPHKKPKNKKITRRNAKMASRPNKYFCHI